MKIVLKSNDLNQSLTRRLCVSFDKKNVYAKFNLYPYKISFSLDEFNSIMLDYEPISLMNGLHPQQRLLFKKFPIAYNDSAISGIIRLLPLIYLTYGLNVIVTSINIDKEISAKNKKNNKFGEYFLNNLKNIYPNKLEKFGNQILIEKTGTLGPQPTAYILPEKAFSEKNLTPLFKKGLLVKMIIKILENDTKSLFIFPLHLTSILKKDKIFFNSTWNEIMKLREQKIMEMF